MLIKKIVFVASLATVISLSACGGKRTSIVVPAGPISEEKIKLVAKQIELQKEIATNQEKINKLRPASEREALNLISTVNKQRENERKYQIAVTTNADIQGCEAGTVLVSPRASVTSLLNGWLQAPYVSVRFFNPRSNGEPVDIEATDYGLVVKNLCVGGRVTIYRQFHYGVDGEQVNWNYKVIGLESGGFQNAQGYSMYVDIRGNGTVTRNQTYDMSIQIPK